MNRVFPKVLALKTILLLLIGASLLYYHDVLLRAIMDFSFGGIIPGTEIALSPEVMLLAVAGTSGFLLIWQIVSLAGRLLHAVQRRKRRRLEAAARQTYNYQIVAAQPKIYHIRTPLRMKFRIFWMHRLERFDDFVCLIADKLGVFGWRMRNLLDGLIRLGAIILLWFPKTLATAAIRASKLFVRSWVRSQPYLRRFDAWLEIRTAQFVSWVYKKLSRQIEQSETMSVIIDAIGGSLFRKSKFRPMAAKVYADKQSLSR